MKSFNFIKSTWILAGLLAGSLSLLSLWNFPGSQAQSAEQLTSSSSSGSSEQAADEKAVRDQADRFAKAFSSAQAEPIAAMCSEDCTLTDADGIKFSGRDEILKLYQRTFQEDGANPSFVHIDSLTFPAPGVCIEDGTFYISRVNSETRYSVVHLKRNGAWQMFRINESAYNPAPAETLKELSWMVGNWTLKHDDKTVSLAVNPIAHGNFISMRFSDKQEQSFDCDQLQLIGWSFKTKDIVSWHYSDDGSFGFGHWLRNGSNSNWIVDTRGVRRDGAVTTAKYKIDKIDDDHFRWQAVSRESGGEKLPDMPPVDVIRNK